MSGSLHTLKVARAAGMLSLVSRRLARDVHFTSRVFSFKPQEPAREHSDLQQGNSNPGLGAAQRASRAEEAIRGAHKDVNAVDQAKTADRSGALRAGDTPTESDGGFLEAAGRKVKEVAANMTGAALGKQGLDAYGKAAYDSLKSHAEEKHDGTAEMSRTKAQFPLIEDSPTDKLGRIGQESVRHAREKLGPIMGLQDEKGQLDKRSAATNVKAQEP